MHIIPNREKHHHRTNADTTTTTFTIARKRSRRRVSSKSKGSSKSRTQDSKAFPANSVLVEQVEQVELLKIPKGRASRELEIPKPLAHSSRQKTRTNCASVKALPIDHVLQLAANEDHHNSRGGHTPHQDICFPERYMETASPAISQIARTNLLNNRRPDLPQKLINN